MSATTITTLEPGTWNIDPTHTIVEFSARHMVVSNVKGQFRSVAGTVQVPDGSDPAGVRIDVHIDAASIDTNNADRDAHLSSADFLEVDAYPEITFTSTRVEERSDGEYLLVGDLTVRDTTRPVELPVEFQGILTDPYGLRRAGFSASTTISRKEWGLVWNALLETGGAVVGDKVKINLDLEITKA